MRLIDADKYCDFLNTYPLEKAQNNFMPFYRKALQETLECEVKAIPIEWLKRLQGRYLEAECNMSVCVVNEILNLWEKENEAD